MNLTANACLQGGKYRIIRLLRQASSGNIYEAELVPLHQRVLLKAFNAVLPSATNSLCAVQHPSILRVTDVFEEQGCTFHVSDYVAGGTLAQLMQLRGTLPEDEAQRYRQQVFEAQEYVYKQTGTRVHVTPDGIFIDRTGKAYIINMTPEQPAPVAPPPVIPQPVAPQPIVAQPVPQQPIAPQLVAQETASPVLAPPASPHRTTVMVCCIAAVLLAGLGVGAYFLFKSDKAEEAEDVGYADYSKLQNEMADSLYYAQVAPCPEETEEVVAEEEPVLETLPDVEYAELEEATPEMEDLDSYLYEDEDYEIEWDDEEEVEEVYAAEEEDEEDPDWTAARSNEGRIYEMVETPAEFPGGNDACFKWIAEHLKYPTVCLQEGVQGRVTVQFVVNTDGSIVDINVLRSPHELLSLEAVRVIEMMPKWKPARMNNIPVRSRYNLPIKFALT